jgi:hypothetical protein
VPLPEAKFSAWLLCWLRQAKSGCRSVLKALQLKDGRVFLFDAACPGASDPSKIEADPGAALGTPGPGTVAVSRAHDGMTDFVRLVRTGGDAKKQTKKRAEPAQKKAPAKKQTPASKSVEPVWKTRPISIPR